MILTKEAHLVFWIDGKRVLDLVEDDALRMYSGTLAASDIIVGQLEVVRIDETSASQSWYEIRPLGWIVTRVSLCSALYEIYQSHARNVGYAGTRMDCGDIVISDMWNCLAVVPVEWFPPGYYMFTTQGESGLLVEYPNGESIQIISSSNRIHFGRFTVHGSLMIFNVIRKMVAAGA